MDANAVKQTPMPLQSQKPMLGMAIIHTTLATTILAKEKLRLSHNHGMDMEDMAMEVMLDIGDANAVKLKLTASHITMDITHTSVDITILANDLLKPNLTHGEDTTVDGVDMDMEDMVKFVYHENQTSMN